MYSVPSPHKDFLLNNFYRIISREKLRGGVFINPRSTLHCNFLFMFVFCLVVLNNSKRLMSHESQSPRLEALLFYSAVPTYTNSGICREIGLFFRLGDPNDANSNTKIENGKDFAKIRDVQVNHSEKKTFQRWYILPCKTCKHINKIYT